MQLLKYELKKLLINKEAIICAVIALVLLIPSILIVYKYCNSYGSPESVYQSYKPYEGKTSLKCKIYDKTYYTNFSNYNVLTNSYNLFTDDINASYMAAVVNDEVYYYGVGYKDNNIKIGYEEQKMKPSCINTVQAFVKKYASDKNSYEYKKAIKQLSMLEKAGEPQFRYKFFWDKLFFLMTKMSFLLGILIMFILSGIVSKEFSSGMGSVIVSSKYGFRRLKIVKMQAAAIVSAGFIIIENLLWFLILIMCGSAHGWDAKINTIYMIYAFSPYSINMLQYFLICVLFQILSVLFSVALMTFLSSHIENSLISFLIGGVALLFGGFVSLLTYGSSDNPIIDLSLYNAMSVERMFTDYKVYNLFGNPVLLPYIMIALLVAGTAIFSWLTLCKFEKSKITGIFHRKYKEDYRSAKAA